MEPSRRLSQYTQAIKSDDKVKSVKGSVKKKKGPRHPSPSHGVIPVTVENLLSQPLPSPEFFKHSSVLPPRTEKSKRVSIIQHIVLRDWSREIMDG